MFKKFQEKWASEPAGEGKHLLVSTGGDKQSAHLSKQQIKSIRDQCASACGAAQRAACLLGLQSLPSHPRGQAGRLLGLQSLPPRSAGQAARRPKPLSLPPRSAGHARRPLGLQSLPPRPSERAVRPLGL